MKSRISKVFYISCLLLVILSIGNFIPSVYSQSEDTSSNETFFFSIDYATFRGNDSLRFVEFYMAIPLNKLTYVPENEIYRLGFTTTIKAMKEDSVYFNRTVRHPYSSETEKSEKDAKQLLAIEACYLPEGEFQIEAEVADSYGDQSKSYTFPVAVEMIPENELYISDIQLATLIERDPNKSQFYKNGYKVMPNVGNIFGSSLPALFYYSEIYNLDKTDENDKSQFSITARILDAEGNVVKSVPTKVKEKAGKSAVELSRINILAIPSGSYLLELEAIDLKNNQSHTRQKKFFIYRPQDYEKKVAQGGEGRARDTKPEIYPDSRYTVMGEKEINEEFEATKYISTKEEQNTFKKLDLAGKRQYLIEFWAKRDPDPETKKNEQRETYLALLKYANDHFSGFSKGWKTDRGRVLLVYGQPDEVERSPFSSESKPYQIWKFYSLQGGVIFVFVDKRNFGNFELVHSNARGELSDPDWERWISTQ